ncbi:MAG: hypothetical protein ACE1ZI_03920 [Acidobacteriota bacterium]
MCQTNDGFQIAERDLAIRDPGKFVGTCQSGLPEFLFGDIVRRISWDCPRMPSWREQKT